MFFLVWDRIKRQNVALLFFYFFAFIFMVFPIYMIFCYAIVPFIFKQPGAFDLVDWVYIKSIFRSIFVSLVAIFFIFLIAYPFAFFITNIKSERLKNLFILLVSVPLWSSFFVKLIGLKSVFDLINGQLNSTVGLIYVIIGIIYINLPVAIMNFYNVFTDLPKNLINASLDLGNTDFSSFFRVLIPFTRDSIISCIFLIFIPSFTIITIADFLSMDPSNKLIGQLIQTHATGIAGSGTLLSNSKISVLLMMVFSFILASYMFLKMVPKMIFKVSNKLKMQSYKND